MPQKPVQIRDAGKDASVLPAFYSLPGTVYRNDPNYCLPFQEKVIASVERSCFSAAQSILVAFSDDAPVARVVARISPSLKDASGKPMGLLSFFEASNDPVAVRELFVVAVSWLREQGAGMVIGPMDGDTWHRYRLNAGPNDQRPFMMEPYNPAYYPHLWQQAGFRILSSYYSKLVENIPAVLSALEPGFRRAIDSGFTFRPLNIRDFKGELRLLYELSCQIFEGNYLYTHIAESEFIALYADYRSLLDPRLIWFVFDQNKKCAGFVFAVADYFQAAVSMRGGKNLLAKLRFKLNQKKANTVNLKTMGRLPEYARAGLGTALMYKAYYESYQRGYGRANMCLYREGNRSGEFDASLGKVFRTYHLYSFDGSAGNVS